MSFYSDDEFFNLNAAYLQYPSGFHYAPQYAQSFSYPADAGAIEQGIQNAPPTLVDSFLASFPRNYVAPTSANLPIQTSWSDMPALQGPYPDIVADNEARTSLSLAAPVPVFHAARTKAALRIMMSFDDDKDTHDNSAVSGEPLKTTDSLATRLDLDSQVPHPNIQVTMNDNDLMNTGNNKQATTERPELVIRPISPSTLIALTEPCLMAWCTAFDENLAEHGSSACFPSLDGNNYLDTSAAVYNAWGY